jgi:hypothetical protein
MVGCWHHSSPRNLVQFRANPQLIAQAQQPNPPQLAFKYAESTGASKVLD